MSIIHAYQNVDFLSQFESFGSTFFSFSIVLSPLMTSTVETQKIIIKPCFQTIVIIFKMK